MIREAGQGDVYAALTDLLSRKDHGVKLRALGALAQLPYYSHETKEIMSRTPRLLERLMRLVQIDDPWSHDVQQVQLKACRVLAAICSTPVSNPDACRAVVEQPVCLTLFLDLHAYIYIYIYIYTHTHMYVHTFIHTYCI